MAYKNLTIDQFQGLRLLPEQAEAPGSVSMLNADLARDRTQVGTRGGFSRLGTGTATYHRIAPLSGTALAVFRNTGSAAALQELTISTGTFGAADTWGSASTRVTSTVVIDGNMYITSRSGATNNGIQGYIAGNLVDGAVLVGSPRYAAITPTDKRIVFAHYTSSTGQPSSTDGSVSAVFFSNPGVGSGWADNYVGLDPDDGDEITGMVAWREMLFVVKRKYLYVFYGTSVDSTGAAVFNYRRVDLPSRTRVTANLGGENMVAGADGVYLLCGDGVYRTTGGTPELVSRDITPIFDGTADSSMLFPSTSTDWTIGYATNRVFISYPVASTFRTLVFDTVLREWFLWDTTCGQAAQPTNLIEWVNSSGIPTGYFAAGGRVFSPTKTATSDDGTAIVSNYQSGFMTLADGKEAHVRDFDLWGTGTLTHQVATDYGAVDSGTSVTLGTAPTPALGFDTLDRMGRNMSFKVGATSGAWALTRWVARIQGVRDWT